MLESFRKKDAPKSALTTLPPSPYNQLQEALSPVKSEEPRIEPTKTPEPAKAAEPAMTPEPAKATDSVSRLTVGPDIKLKGVEITDCDTLVVEGRVEASMDSRVIEIAEKGVFIGKVGIDIAEIRGRFEGELDARKQLVIRSTGRVSGKIRYGKISIEEGGEISGDVASLGPKSERPANDSPIVQPVKAVGLR